MEKKHIALIAAGAAAAGIAYPLWKMKSSFHHLKRIDEEGSLYELDYKGDYYHPFYRLPSKLMRSRSCTAFMTHNTEGDVITGRNYDMPHKDKNNEITGLNVVVHLHPEGKYASVNVADCMWLAKVKLPYAKGVLEKCKGLTLPLAFIPYLCMDGINEKGLTCSILYLDVKPGEKAVYQYVAGHERITINELLRFTLDQCATVDEAIALAEHYNMTNIINSDFHLFVADASGRSVVLEWRHNRLIVADTDISTNFYNSFDDACDIYYGDVLKETFIQPKKHTREYHYGYGHGFDRFAIVADALEERIDQTQKGYYTSMPQDEAMQLLQKASQQYSGGVTSYTQYSCVYNHQQLSLDICASQDYDNPYHFEV